MKNTILCFILLFTIVIQLNAQEIDTVPINTKELNIKLKRSPLPTRISPLNFEPIKLKPAIVNAKINYWKTKTSVGINVNQAAFSDNWKGGGVNSIAIGGLVNYKAEYVKENYSYVSELITQYGKVKNRGQLEKKTTDRIYWDNKAAMQLSKHWYFFGSINFESQFDKGFSYSRDAAGNEKSTIISKFMSPGYLTESLGFEYKLDKYFSTRIGTGTARQTFVLDTTLYKNNKNNYGVKPGENFKNELAFQVVSNFEKEIFQNINLKSRYAMFIPYDNLKMVDHRLDITVNAKINRFMNTSLTGVILFDRDTDQKVQASQTLALGFMFIFPR